MSHWSSPYLDAFSNRVGYDQLTCFRLKIYEKQKTYPRQFNYNTTARNPRIHWNRTNITNITKHTHNWIELNTTTPIQSIIEWKKKMEMTEYEENACCKYIIIIIFRSFIPHTYFSHTIFITVQVSEHCENQIHILNCFVCCFSKLPFFVYRLFSPGKFANNENDVGNIN